MSRADPKPGRWILPIVIAALVIFTYTFVNALPQAEVGPTTTTLAAQDTTTTVPETTTTTLEPSVQAFLNAVGDFRVTTAELSNDARTTNEDWDARDIEFGDARDLLIDLAGRTQDFAAEVAAFEVPESVTEVWEDVNASAEDMIQAAEGMIDGLVNAEGSEERLAALDDYAAAGEQLDAALQAAVDAAGG
ncbi:MAG TPA: hypothetical protein VGC47_03480 [Acidimicrobiia bacterium]